jgi:hypothetical protein
MIFFIAVEFTAVEFQYSKFHEPYTRSFFKTDREMKNSFITHF